MENSISNRHLAQAFFSVLNKRDFSDLQNQLAKNAALDFPGPGRIEGQKRIITFIKALFRKFPQLEFVVHDVIMEGDRTCIVWTNRGERVDGQEYNNSGITLMHMTDGKIVFISDYFKDTSFAS